VLWLAVLVAPAFVGPMPTAAPLPKASIHSLRMVRTPTPVALLPPSIGPAAIGQTAAVAGAAAATAQVTLFALFRRSSDTAWSSRPGIVAYRVVALALGLTLTLVGGALFLNRSQWPQTAALTMTAPSGTVRFLGAMLFGQLIIWDLPSAAFMKRLRRPDLVLHHLGLAVVALVATSLPVSTTRGLLD